MPSITLPDGSIKEFDQPVSGADIAASIGPGLAKAALALRIDGETRDLATVITEDTTVEIVTAKSDDEIVLSLLRHDAAHILAEAAQELYPGTQITFGPATEDGFYYDFARDDPFTPEDLDKIEEKMRSRARLGTGIRSANGSSTMVKPSRPNGPKRSLLTRKFRSTSRAIGSTCVPGRICRQPASLAMLSNFFGSPVHIGAVIPRIRNYSGSMERPGVLRKNSKPTFTVGRRRRSVITGNLVVRSISSIFRRRRWGVSSGIPKAGLSTVRLRIICAVARNRMAMWR